MLCQLVVWNLGNFELLAKDNVRSGRCGYAIIVSRSVRREPSDSLMHTFWIRATYCVGGHSTRQQARAFLGPQTTDE